MIFNTFDSKMILTLHQPNSEEIRARIFEVFEENEILKVGNMIDIN